MLENKNFKSGTITTGFIDEEFSGGFMPSAPEGKSQARLLALGTAIVACQQAERNEGPPDENFVVIDQHGNRFETSWQRGDDGQTSVIVDGQKQVIFGRTTAPINLFDGTINEVPLAIQIRQSGHHISLTNGSSRLNLTVLPHRFAAMLDHMPAASAGAGAAEIAAPMPGQITKILVAEGDEVMSGQDVAIIEAMKMENVLKAEARGTVTKIHAAEGDNLNVDDLIMSLDIKEE